MHAGTPRPAGARILLTLSAIYSLFAATADFSIAFMHTPMTEEVFVEPPPEANLPRGTVWRLRRALYGLPLSKPAWGACSRMQGSGGAWGLRPSTTEEDGVRMSVHVDDPLVIRSSKGPYQLFEWLGQRVAVKGLETLDAGRGLREVLPGYIEGMASTIGVLQAKTSTTPGIQEADEKPVDAARCRVCRPARRSVRCEGAQLMVARTQRGRLRGRQADP